MAFATLNSDLSYWKKQTNPLFADLTWNIPEQKTGNVAIVGGNSQNFSTVVRISEFMLHNFPFQHVSTLLPDSLRGKLPPLSNLEFLPSTSSGSFAKSFQLKVLIERSDANLIIGDLSKNSETAIALANAIVSDEKPLILARDSIDLLSSEASRWLGRNNLFLITSMAQLQKVFQSVYYPRMILLSQPLLPVIETLHKFTLTYPVTIITLHQDNIIVAHNGEIITTHLADTSYSPLSLWSGQLAAKILALNLYNPGKPLAATAAAILYQ